MNLTTQKAYTLEGDAIGSCGCSVALNCLCLGQDLHQKGCDSFVAYHIQNGVIAGHDVSALTVVRIMREKDQTAFLYIDGNGTEQQQNLLIQAFTGELGGVLETIYQTFPQHGPARVAPITFEVRQERASLWIGRVLVRQEMKRTAFQYCSEDES